MMFFKPKTEIEKVTTKYPEHVPTMIDHVKYLLPFTLTLEQLNYILRKKMEKSDPLIITTTGGLLENPTSTLKHMYDTYKSDDGFLHLCTND